MKLDEYASLGHRSVKPPVSMLFWIGVEMPTNVERWLLGGRSCCGC